MKDTRVEVGRIRLTPRRTLLLAVGVLVAVPIMIFCPYGKSATGPSPIPGLPAPQAIVGFAQTNPGCATIGAPLTVTYNLYNYSQHTLYVMIRQYDVINGIVANGTDLPADIAHSGLTNSTNDPTYRWPNIPVPPGKWVQRTLYINSMPGPTVSYGKGTGLGYAPISAWAYVRHHPDAFSLYAQPAMCGMGAGK